MTAGEEPGEIERPGARENLAPSASRAETLRHGFTDAATHSLAHRMGEGRGEGEQLSYAFCGVCLNLRMRPKGSHSSV